MKIRDVICRVLSMGLLLGLGSALSAAEELLINRDFAVGSPTDDKPPVFQCKGWRRLLWNPKTPSSWLTDGTRDRQIGEGNQALEFRWGATSICQYFSATEEQEYDFSVEHLNGGNQESRWNPRIQVEWYDAAGQRIGDVTTVVEGDITTAPVKTWNALNGEATSPPATAYARILFNINNRGAGSYFQKAYFDNASVQGQRGTHNLPCSFVCAPYDMTLDAIPESTPYGDSLAEIADDPDGDTLRFTKVEGPGWLTVARDGALSGTPRFEDAGDNRLKVKVEDSRGSSDTRTLTIPVVPHLRLGNVFDDDMVLQRGAPIPLWGRAVPNARVKVALSTGEAVQTSADAEGNWSMLLPPLRVSAAGPITMTVTSGPREFAATNVLVGDVWLCSGQSNMSWPLKHTDGSAEEIAVAENPHLRVLRTPETRSKEPWQDLHVRAQWRACTPKEIPDFSAVAYYFGKTLAKEIGVPIGLIDSSQGGSAIEPWSVSLLPENATTMYKSRIHPYTRLPIKGVIWYQGEANVGNGAAYTDKMKTLVADWRKVWKRPELPFYFVQLAPFNYKGDNVYQLPELWAAQAAAMAQIPHSGMVVTNDVGNIKNIHPTNKAPVGQRLAAWALHGTYGRTDVAYSGPVLEKVTRVGQRLSVSFRHAENGLASRDGEPLTCFEVAGADGEFGPAKAAIVDGAVLVSSPAVRDPAAVRFAWHETAQPNLMNVEGLPAGAFPAASALTRFPVVPAPKPLTPLMERELRGCFDFFWNEWVSDPTKPTYGLTNGDYVGLGIYSPIPIEAQGFYLCAIVVGVERGWITRNEGVERAVIALETLGRLKHIRGFYYHFIDPATGLRGWHDAHGVELSNGSTGTMLMGALVAGEYFGGKVEELAESLYARTDWKWFTNPETKHPYLACFPEDRPPKEPHGGMNEEGFFGSWAAYSEHMFLYILGAGAPNPEFATGADSYYAMKTYRGSYKGEEFFICGTGGAFTYQWTHSFVDFRNIRDRLGRNWFENSRHAAIAARQYAIDRAPELKGLGPNSWGMSACMSPSTFYSGRYGSKPIGAGHKLLEDGTVPPYGSSAFVVFTPKESIEALEYMVTIPGLVGKYGLHDAYSFMTKNDGDKPWIGESYLGIDKGLVLLMFENYSTQLIWRLCHRNRHIQRGLEVLEFSPQQ